VAGKKFEETLLQIHMKNSFLRVNIFVLIIANSANVFSYFFQFIMGRYLSIEDFSVLTSVNSLGIIVGGVLGVVPYIVSKYIIELKGRRELLSNFLRQMFIVTLYALGVFSLSVILFIGNIGEYLKLENHLPIYIFLLNLNMVTLLSVSFGAMQGLLMHVRVSIKGALVSVLRLIFAIVIVVFMGYSYNGALLASLLANVIVGLWVYSIVNKHIPLKNIKHKPISKEVYKNIVSYALPVSLTWLAIGLITNIDVVLVKHYASEVEAGEYSVAAIIARIAVFLPGVLLTVLFPQVSQNNVDGKSSIATLLVVMMLTLLLAGCFAITVYFFPEAFITLLFGDKFLGGTEALIIIAFAMSIVAIISVIFNFFLAKNLYSYLYVTYILFAISAVYIYKIDNFTAIDIAYAVLYICVALLITNSLLLFYYWYRGPRKNAI